MKKPQTICIILLVFSIISIINISCHTTVKTAVSCPEISIKKSIYKVHHKKRNENIFLALKTDSKNRRNYKSKQVQKEEVNTHLAVYTERKIHISKIEYNKSLIASADNSNVLLMSPPATMSSPCEITNFLAITGSFALQEVKCDTIFLKSGAILNGKVEEIGTTEIKYRKCNNLTGPVISIFKGDVFRIHYSNGTDDLFGPSDSYIPNAAERYSSNANQINAAFYKPEPQKTDGFAIAGFVSGLVGLFVASIPLGIIAVVFGGVALSKIKRNPGRRGRGLAIAAIILGIIDVVAMLILLNQVLAT